MPERTRASRRDSRTPSVALPGGPPREASARLSPPRPAGVTSRAAEHRPRPSGGGARATGRARYIDGMPGLRVCIDVDDLDHGDRVLHAGARAHRPGDGRAASGRSSSARPAPIDLLAKPPGTAALPRGTRALRDYERHWTPVHLDVVVDDLDAAVRRAVDAGAKLERDIEPKRVGDDRAPRGSLRPRLLPARDEGARLRRGARRLSGPGAARGQPCAAGPADVRRGARRRHSGVCPPTRRRGTFGLASGRAGTGRLDGGGRP